MKPAADRARAPSLGLASIALLLLLGARAVVAEAPLGHERFLEAYRAGELDAAAAVLDEWKKREGMTTAQIHVDHANLWFARSRDVSLSVSTDISPPRAGESAVGLRDPDTGEARGSIREVVTFERDAGTRAAQYLADALVKWPKRLDIHLGRATILRELGRYDPMLSALDAACRQTLSTPRDMRWMDDASVDVVHGTRAAEFLPGAMQAFSNRFTSWANEEGDALAESVATLAIRHFPGHAHAYNTLGSIHFFRGDSVGAAEMFEKAHSLAPRDVMISSNLSRCHEALGDRPAAIADLKLALEVAADEPTRSALRQRIRSLESQSGGP